MNRNTSMLSWILASGLLCASGVAATAAPPEPVVAPQPRLDIREIRLDNGLRIFVLERAASPTFAAYYVFGVGGAADPRGRSGIAHLLEHMMFKGTERVGTLDPQAEAPLLARLSELWHELDRELDRTESPFERPDPDKLARLEEEIARVTAEHKQLVVKNEFDELMTRAGGVSENASTGNDSTDYYIQLPANQLETWFKLESDRLLHPVFREFWSERDVVHEERRTSTENQAEGLAYEALERLMFLAHPYGNPVVGWPRDVARLKAEDALAYFRTFYSPSNCTMVLVGDVKTADIERLAKKYLAPWARREIPALDITSEPEQKGERRAVVEFDAEPSLLLGWVTVPVGHADHYALDVLARILGGLASSRLDKTLVQGERIASSVATFHDPRKWSGEFLVSAYSQGEHTLAELESAIEREVRRIQDAGVTADELERAKIQTEVARVRSLKSNLGQAYRIGTAVAAAGRVDYLYEYETRLAAVTASDVQAAAKRYLTDARESVVEVRKTPGASGAPAGDEAADAHHRGGETSERGAKHSAGFDEAMTLIAGAKPLTLRIPEIGKDVRRVVLPSGVTVFLKEDHSAPTVDIELAWLGGSNTTPVAQLAPFVLASDLLTEGGTEKLDPIALDERKEQLGMSFDISVGGTESGASFWSLGRNFRESFDLAMDMLMRPRLDGERLDTLKGQYIDDMRRRYDYPDYGVYLIENHVLYRDHPRLGYLASRDEVAAITPDAIRRLWKRYFGRDNLYVTAVGDFDGQEMLDLLERTFATWRKAEDKKRDFLPREPVTRPGVFLVEKEVSAPAVRLTQQLPVDRRAPLADHAALEILNDILGGSGFRSRLMERLRSDEGLTYGIYSYLFHDGRPGVPGGVGASYETKRASVERSIASVVEEFGKLARGKVSAAETAEQIDAWRNRFVFRYTNDFYSVTRLMHNELDDRPYDYDRRLLDAIQKVTPADVERVAHKYLKPDRLSIAVFGAPTDADKKALHSKFGLKVLPKAAVFRGGYDEPEPAAEETP
jgi:predicted Zn-dependent peptidase